MIVSHFLSLLIFASLVLWIGEQQQQQQQQEKKLLTSIIYDYDYSNAFLSINTLIFMLPSHLFIYQEYWNAYVTCKNAIELDFFFIFCFFLLWSILLNIDIVGRFLCTTMRLCCRKKRDDDADEIEWENIENSKNISIAFESGVYWRFCVQYFVNEKNWNEQASDKMLPCK